MQTSANAPSGDGAAATPAQKSTESYPQHGRERELLTERKSSAASDPLGVGISGGGIRSATFALGMFQALADERKAEPESGTLLRDIDFMSTVSGGGYFGGFYGSLFLPKRRARSADSTKPPSEDHWQTLEEMLAPNSPQIRYLRENGAYLAPARPGDLLLGMAVLARNWVAVVLVLLALVVVMSLGLDLAPFVFGSHWPALRAMEAELVAWSAPKGVLPSSLLLAIPPLFFGWIVPASGAYFLLGLSIRQHAMKWGVAMLAQILLLAGCVLLHERHEPAAWFAFLVVAMVTAFRTSADFVGERQVRAGQSSSREPVEAGRLILWIACVLLALLLQLAAVGPAFLPSEVWLDPAEWTGKEYGRLFFWPGLVVFAVLADLLLQLAAYLLSRHPEAQSGTEHKRVDVDQYVRHCVSSWLRNGLIVAGVLLFGAVVHSLGRTLYAQAMGDIEVALGIVASLGAALATAARRVVVKAGKGPDGERPKWFLTLAQYAGGGVALVALLVTGVLLAQLIVFQAKGPIVPRVDQAELAEPTEASAPCPRLPSSFFTSEAEDPTSAKSCWAWARIEAKAPSEPAEKTAHATEQEEPMLRPLDVDPGSREASDHYPGPADDRVLRIVNAGVLTLAGMFLVLLAIGGLREFLNNSTHLALYSARITRTFLGASNRDRVPPSSPNPDSIPPAAVKDVATHLIPGDDIELEDYFRRDRGENASESPYALGAPLHLVNVTINETIDGRSRTEQAARRGVGMAIGPCGLSVGVRHHALFEWNKNAEPSEADVYPPANTALVKPPPYRVFGFAESSVGDHKGRFWPKVRTREPGAFPHERLSLGRWLGISGAAFTTGLGSRTNVGLSLMLGLANVRLGHWWRSGVKPVVRTGKFLGWLFWTQQYLLRELFARFAGTSDRLWYLSDGGHFENLGGYELIRRRLRRIVILDAEADPKRKFDGLANLVRKARIDFGAEIEFLDEADLADIDGDRDRGLVPLTSLCPKDEEKWIGGYAALARITYPTRSWWAGERDTKTRACTGWLLYVKPSLMGDEPADVLQYHRENGAFPHETTGDQFFDEAQWESYRCLGEHIGRRLFRNGTLPFSQLKWEL